MSRYIFYGYKITSILLTMLFFAINWSAQSQSIKPDSSFGNSGVKVLSPGDYSQILDDPRGFTYLLNNRAFGVDVIKYSRNGQLDSLFGNNGSGTINMWYWGRYGALDSSGRIIIGGAHKQMIYYDILITRLNLTGQIDNNFNFRYALITVPNTTYDELTYMELVGDKLLLTGKSYNTSILRPVYQYFILNTDGTIYGREEYQNPNTSFRGFGWGKGFLVKIDDPLTGTILRRYSDNNTIDASFGTAGDLRVSGNPTIYNNQLYILRGDSLHRYTNTGTPDPGFNSIGRQFVRGSRVIFQPGKIYIQDSTQLTRLNENGSYDNSFNGTGKQTIQGLSSLFRQGKIYIYGDSVISRLTNDGSYDTSFNGSGKQPVPASEITFLNEKIMVVGNSTISRLYLNGYRDSSFGVNGIYSTKDLSGLHRIVIDSNKLYIRARYKPATATVDSVALAAFTLQLCTGSNSTWLGITSNWNTPSNWSANAVPDACTNVTISTGTGIIMPIVTGQNNVCKKIILNNGVNITIATGARLTIVSDQRQIVTGVN